MAAEPAQAPLHRLDVQTYDKIVASGALDGQRVELLHGAIAQMSPQSPAHTAVIEALMDHFAHARGRLRVQMPLEVPPHSEPEPDLALLAGSPPQGRHPRTALLVVEVAVSSQQVDRGVKAKLYARADVPTYWLIDVPARTIEVRTQPGPGGYGHLEIHGQDGVVPCELKGVADLDVAALLAGVAE